MSLNLIATPERPLRASFAANLTCGLRATLLMLDGDSSDRAAANTGTLAHVGIEAWIRGSTLLAANDAVLQRQSEFRAAREAEGDAAAATAWVAAYAADPRNGRLNEWPADRQYGRVLHVEQPVALRLPPADFDESGQEVCLVGTLDQLRERPDGALWVWDVKSGRIDNGFSVWQHATQLAVYAAAASAMLGKPVFVGGLILLRGYDARLKERRRVFVEVPLQPQDVALVLESVAEQVAHLRNGYVTPSIGRHCSSCFAVRSGPAECLRRLDQLKG